MIMWRGWGISAVFLLFFWFLVLCGVVLSIVPYQPDAVKAGLDFQWCLAGAFMLDAACVYLLDRYRMSHPRAVVDPRTQATVLVAHVDDLAFIRFELWAYILLLLAAAVAVATLLGYQIFSD